MIYNFDMGISVLSILRGGTLGTLVTPIDRHPRMPCHINVAPLLTPIGDALTNDLSERFLPCYLYNFYQIVNVDG